MAVYLISTKVPVPELDALVTASYPGAVKWADSVYIAHTIESARQVAERLGVSPEDDGASKYGHILVIKLSASYWGWGPSEFWDALQTAFKSAD